MIILLLITVGVLLAGVFVQQKTMTRLACDLQTTNGILKVAEREHNKLRSQTEALAETLSGGTWFKSDEVEKVLKRIEYLEIRAQAPMTLILDQKAPLKVIHRQAREKKVLSEKEIRANVVAEVKARMEKLSQ